MGAEIHQQLLRNPSMTVHLTFENPENNRLNVNFTQL